MKNFIGKYQQQEQENQVFLGKKLEIQVNLFIQGFNCQEQMTFYYLNALGMWEYNYNRQNEKYNFWKQIVQILKLGLSGTVKNKKFGTGIWI